MLINSLSLKNFRNYSNEIINFSKHINIFLGENAQGKTNLIESIYLLSTTKSYRLKKDIHLILFNKEFLKIKAQLSKIDKDYSIEYIVSNKGKKLKVNNVEQKKISDYIGLVNVVLFAPEDLSLIKGQPTNRRKFIDTELSKINTIYLKYISYYQKILKQRNNYLKKFNHKIDNIYLDILTDQLYESAAHIIYYRLNFIEQLENFSNKFLNVVTQNKETLKLIYQSQLQNIFKENIKEKNKMITFIKNEYINLCFLHKEKELENKTTLFGPHRDDLQFILNNKDIQNFGSQGQQRTVILCLKLGEVDYIKEKTGEYPLLLLDDVLSELDNSRQTFLLKSIENKIQTFITTTSLENIEKNSIEKSKIFHIEKGSVRND